ncbi:hypothetical protein, partial [Ferruginibacter sp.]
TFINQAGAVLNVNLQQSNAYAVNTQGTFTNQGTIRIGDAPYNPGSKGVYWQVTAAISAIPAASHLILIRPTAYSLIIRE